MTGRFSEKLDRLAETAALAAARDARIMAKALDEGRTRPTIAIGSGGSAIAADYFARCRETLFSARTFVETPMQFVLGASSLAEYDIWLFSASSDNADVIAAVETAIKRRARSIHLITRNPEGLAALKATAAGGLVHAVPVADLKDGYLATHSLVATTSALLIASDLVSGAPVGAELVGKYLTGVAEGLSRSARENTRDRFRSLESGHTLLILADPQVRPVATLIDTSLWESGICPVQTTDFRNFAHGRHAWIHQRTPSSMVLALTGEDSRGVWRSLKDNLPDALRSVEVDLGRCGRLANALGLIDALVLVEAMGAAVGTDPGRPPIGANAKDIYENPALLSLSADLPPPIEHKRAAVLRQDDPLSQHLLLVEARKNWLNGLAEAVFGGIVLDYDGTIVRTADRFSPPGDDLIIEIERLLSHGMKVAIATGRGSSAGKDLRKVVKPGFHADVTIAYYNGGYIRTLDIDTKIERPSADASIEEAIAWLSANKRLFVTWSVFEPGVQITIQQDDLANPETFAVDVSTCPPIADGRVRLTRSAHSFDLIPSTTTKLAAVRAITEELDEGFSVLCVGDSGSRSGNDYAILATPHGISVGDVCGLANGCWSFFGDHLLGPDALLELLRALKPFGSKGMKIDVASLTFGRNWT
ncbi:HAD hydrolase family protein (plasmid) [Rhizobium sp. CB3060]|uniref:HAD hydrolase family protein n=1 Tax=Rhizobium sp. CB3060 TaxID=3138255 RepID=UPI0021A69433|nr:HAD hydrolase family protein [Rhizobium tropici]UWU25945.1 HAD hydrolase family protein [Rhizobium tropici]